MLITIHAAEDENESMTALPCYEPDCVNPAVPGLFHKLWKKGLLEYDKKKNIVWKWQAMDGAITKAPLGGEKNRQ